MSVEITNPDGTKYTPETSQESAQQPITQTTGCQHYLEWESRDIAVCSRGCGHGIMLNPDFFEIRNGKVFPKTPQDQQKQQPKA